MSTKRKLLNKTLAASVSLIALVTLGAGEAYSATKTPSAGTTTITGADTWDLNDGLGGSNNNISFDNIGGDVSYTITNTSGAAASGNLGAITVRGPEDDNGTISLVIGDGSTNGGVTITVNSNITGNLNFDNNLDITVDADNLTGSSNSTLAIKGNLSLGNGDMILDQDGSDVATLRFNGSSAQTVTAASIKGGGANEGVLDIINSAGVTFDAAIGGTTLSSITVGSTAAGVATFNSTVATAGGLTIGADGFGSSATFKNTTNATSGIALGTSGVSSADTNTATFNATGGAFTVTGAVSGAASGDTNAIVVAGSSANAVTFATNFGSNIDTITVGNAAAGSASFSGTVTTSGALTIGSTDTVSGSNATFKNTVSVGSLVLGATGATADTNTATFNATGGAFTVTGAISGAGAADTDAIVVAGSSSNAVTFATNFGSNIDTITIGNAAAGSASFSGTVTSSGALTIGSTDTVSGSNATFKNTVSVGSLVLGAAGGTADTNTATFNATGGAFTVTGAISGAGAADTDAIVVAGSSSNAVTFATNFGSNIDTVTIGNAAAGSASFSGTVTTSGALTIGSTDTVSGSNATFTNTVSVGSFVFGAAGATNDTNAATFDSSGGSFTVTGAVSAAGAADTNTITIAGGANAVTFASNITGIDLLTINEDSTLKVNGSTSGTNVVINEGGTFYVDIDTNKSYQSTSTALNGASAGVGILEVAETNSNSAVFAGNVGVTSLAAIKIGSSTSAQDTTAKFQGDVSATAITLGETTGTDDVTIIFDTNQEDTDNTVTGTINEATSGTDTTKINIIDSELTNVNSVTFSNIIGGTKAVNEINIGDGFGSGGKAIFSADVTAGDITINATDGGDTIGAVGDFNAEVTATTITLSGGDVTEEDAAATFANDVTAAIVLNDGTNGGTSKVTFDGVTAQTLTGYIGGATAGEGSLLINNDLIVTGGIGVDAENNYRRLDSVSLAADKTLTLGQEGEETKLAANSISISGTVKPLGSIALGGQSTITFSNNATINITNTELDGNALFNATAGATIAAGETDEDLLTILLPQTNINDVILFDASGDGSLDLNSTINIADTILSRYSLNTEDNVVTIVREAKSSSEVSRNLNVSESAVNGMSSAIQAALLGNDQPVIAAYLQSLEEGGIESRKAAEQSTNTSATLSSAAQVASRVSDVSLSPISAHLESFHSGKSSNSGLSSGSEAASNSLWIKPFYNQISQEKSNGVTGYEAETSGATVGADLFSTDNIITGISLSYAKTDVNGESLARDSVDIDSYQIALYSGYNTDRWYLNSFLGYGYNDSKTKRYIDFGGLDRIALGEFSGQQYLAKVDAGLPVQILQESYFTPLAGLGYTHVTNDNYTETGAGTLNLRVNTRDIDIIQGSIGARVHTEVPVRDGKLIPQIHAKLLYDFSGDEGESTSTFTSGGPSFRATGNEKEQLGGNAGAGLSYDVDRVSVSLGYDAEIRPDFLSHTASVEAKLKF